MIDPGQHDPQAAHQAKNQERVIEPDAAPKIYTHQNACSPEQEFECKRDAHHNCITGRLYVPALLAVVLLLAVGCVVDPQRAQAADLLSRLELARGMFLEQPPRYQTACDAVGDVQTRLNYEPGLSNVRPAWGALSDAAQALQAVCGDHTLLALPALRTPSVVAADARWQQTIERELGVACDHLREAAAALTASTPC